jgi:hypothetical protein
VHNAGCPEEGAVFKTNGADLFVGDDTGVIICGLGDEIENYEQL